MESVESVCMGFTWLLVVCAFRVFCFFSYTFVYFHFFFFPFWNTDSVFLKSNQLCGWCRFAFSACVNCSVACFVCCFCRPDLPWSVPFILLDHVADFPAGKDCLFTGWLVISFQKGQVSLRWLCHTLMSALEDENPFSYRCSPTW